MSVLSKSLVVFVSILMVAIAPASAQTSAWRIIETEGAVRTMLPVSGMQMISTGGTLDAGAVLTTGMDGRAVLARGDQTIIVGPSSRMSLPGAEEAGMTRIFQDLGTLLFKVDKRDKQHFSVETPVIAAVVKGTTFTVSTNADSHVVHVAEGAVEVSSLNGASAQMVTAGMTARVFKSNPSVIEMKTEAPYNDSGDRPQGNGELILPTEIGADELDFATLTDGLAKGAQNSASTATQARFNQETPSASNGGFGKAISELRRTGVNNNQSVRALEVGIANSNANGAANSNAGGNGNGKAIGVVNSNAGGNGNGNAIGVVNSNAGGNGNGNANGAVNTNAGGNGNGNANGAANSNAGGNGRNPDQ